MLPSSRVYTTQVYATPSHCAATASSSDHKREHVRCVTRRAYAARQPFAVPVVPLALFRPRQVAQWGSCLAAMCAAGPASRSGRGWRPATPTSDDEAEQEMLPHRRRAAARKAAAAATAPPTAAPDIARPAFRDATRSTRPSRPPARPQPSSRSTDADQDSHNSRLASNAGAGPRTSSVNSSGSSLGRRAVRPAEAAGQGRSQSAPSDPAVYPTYVPRNPGVTDGQWDDIDSRVVKEAVRDAFDAVTPETIDASGAR